MSEPTYHYMLGLYLTVEEYLKHVVPGQTIYVWMPPDFERMTGVAGQAWAAGESSPMPVVKLDDGGVFQVTDRNVFIFQPGPMPKKRR